MKPLTLKLLALCTLGLLPSCSYHSEKLPKLSEIKNMRFYNPFSARVPVRSVSEEELAAMQDQTIASFDANGLPNDSLGPVDFSPADLPEGHDLLSASLLPSKTVGSVAVINADGSVPEHKPIIPTELLDEEDVDTLSLQETMDLEPLVPFAPVTVQISEPSGEIEESIETEEISQPSEAPAEAEKLEISLTDEIAE